MEQLSLVFEVPTTENDGHITYRRFLMLDYLEQLESRTALVHYDDGFTEFSVPVQLGEMIFSSFPKNLPEVCRLKASDSQIHFGNSPSSLTVEGAVIQATYSKTLFGSDRKQDKEKTVIHEGLSGRTRIELKAFDAPTWKRAKVLKKHLAELISGERRFRPLCLFPMTGSARC